jgi:ketosteroid isomerase-like protein
MLRGFAKVGCLLVVFTFLFSCGDVEEIGRVQPEEYAAINKVLKQWREGYENEDVELYMNVYWKDKFLYVSDMGTDDDTTDDLIFDNWDQERESAIRVFRLYQDIEIEISEPPEIDYLDEAHTRAEVKNHYRIQGFIASGESLEGGYTGWFAEGDNRFIFESRSREWRIQEWHDEAFSKEEIAEANN